ncbi:MAG: metal-dependent transcriptional regulator [Georgenia sp.]
MSDLIDTTEMYLKTIFELEEEGVPALRARIAERLGHSGPTVSQTVARMERDGLLVLTDNRRLRLTEAGQAKATRVMRKHRLAERLLTDVVGLEWPFVHEEACRWEHVMSERVERRLLELLDHPDFDPYGNPIPGLAQLGEAGPARATPVRSLADVVAETSRDDPPTEPRTLAGESLVRLDVELTRIGEPLQVDVELLGRLADAGLRPGIRVEVAVRGDGHDVVSLRAPGAEVVLDLPDEITRHLYVRP